MTDWTPEEDEAFNMVEKNSNLGKQILRANKSSGMDCCTYDCTQGRNCPVRNKTLDEVAHEFSLMKSLGDTAQSFAAFVRGMEKMIKTCCGECGECWYIGNPRTCKCPDETPKREWIKLTNDEIEKCWKTAMKLNNGKGADITNQPFFHLARMVEYMLEEKNHG